MIIQRIGLVAVAVVASGIVAYKASRSTAVETNDAAQAAQVTAKPIVLLFADLREADADEPCGEIIRAVRSAGQRGVQVREVPPADADTERRYGVTVAPTVLFLDEQGAVAARFEGEGREVVDGIKANLAKLTGKP